jgi:hypothetical protein
MLRIRQGEIVILKEEEGERNYKRRKESVRNKIMKRTQGKGEEEKTQRIFDGKSHTEGGGRRKEHRGWRNEKGIQGMEEGERNRGEMKEKGVQRTGKGKKDYMKDRNIEDK